jgi:phage FluMu gp28-like protein
MAHILNHTKHDFETKISRFFLLSSEKEILRKRVQDVGIQNFEFIFEEEVMAYIENHTKHDLET